MTSFAAAVTAAVARLGAGEVVTYGDVAAEVGHPGAARAVGTVLARSTEEIPWWRVVTSTGRLVPGREHEHARLLESEGVLTSFDERTARPCAVPAGRRHRRQSQAQTLGAS